MNAARGGVVVSCEHATNRVPAALRGAFGGAREALAGHRGWDPGSLEIATAIAGELAAPLVVGRVSRLVVDCNRSATHPRVFSEWTKALDASAQAALLTRWHEPHRAAVERLVAGAIDRCGACAHISVHTFTPVLDGKTRTMDVGLLYDPSRPSERALADGWQRAIGRVAPALVVRRNAPYKGVSDGLCTSLRRRFGPEAYAGIELEVNQRLLNRRAATQRIADQMAKSLAGALAD